MVNTWAGHSIVIDIIKFPILNKLLVAVVEFLFFFLNEIVFVFNRSKRIGITW